MKKHIGFLFVSLIWIAPESAAQTLSLHEAATNVDIIAAQVGDTITIEIIADLGKKSASGIAFFITIPEGPFQVVDQGFPGQVGIQPFLPGPLFEGATQRANNLLSETDNVATLLPGLQLEYAVVTGTEVNRSRTGAGVVATFSLWCINPVVISKIVIDDNPVRETRLVLPDGISEQRFRTIQGIEITVQNTATVLNDKTWGKIKRQVRPF